MTQELKREVGAAEVFQRGHFSKKKGKFVDKQADKVWENFETLRRDYMSNNNNEEAANNDELFYEALGGLYAKGRLYGLGCAGELYYGNQKCIKRQRTTNLDLRTKVADHQQQIDQLGATVEQLTQTHCGRRSSPNFPPTPPPPSSSGHGIAA